MWLPSEYQEVEYIENTWSSYINTGYKPSVNTEISTKLSRWWTQEYWAVFFWVTWNDTSTDWILWRLYYSSSSWSTQTFNTWFCNSTYGEHQNSASLNTFHTVILKKNQCTFDWTSYTLTTSWSPYSWNIFLFCWNNWWSAWRYWKCKMWPFTISESWVIKKCFVPCYKKSNSTIWMYDLVWWTFYTNAWTWTFTKWPDV